MSRRHAATYFGNACGFGHDGERYVRNRVCIHCARRCAIDYYYRHQEACIAAASQRAMERYWQDPAAQIERVREYQKTERGKEVRRGIDKRQYLKKKQEKACQGT